MNKRLVKLEGAALTKSLHLVPLWSVNKKCTELCNTFTFKDHINALVFIARITVHAQVRNHHPEIIFTFKKVKVVLTTHDVKGLTKNDIEFATQIDHLMKVDN